MASWPPKKNAAFTFYVGLIDQADTKLLKASPTLAAGDVKVAIDDGAPANLATLPVVDADFTKRVKVAMSAAEMNGDRITVVFSDAAGAEWADLITDIPTSTRQVDDLAFPTTSGRSLDVATTGEVGVDFNNILGTLDAADIGADAIGASELAADAVAEIADGVWDEVLTGATHNVTNSSGRRLRQLEDATLIRGNAFQAGSTTTSLVLDAAASAVDGFFDHTLIKIVDGVAAGQERVIADYNGTTKAATITPVLVTAAPASGDGFEIISGGSVHAETQGGGYEGGAVWIDTIDGVAGTLLYVNGTVDNPSNSIADARTLVDALGMHVFHSLPGSTFTLAQTFNDFEFIGAGFTVALGGQDIGGSRFFNCAVSGIGTGSTRIVFRDCLFIGATTLPTSSILGCNLTSDITLSSAGIYRITDGVHGSATAPAIDFGATVLNTTVHIHGYSGAITVKNMGQLGTDVLHFDSAGGKLTLDATCIGGTVNINGTFQLVDNSSGMTINKAGAIIEMIGTPVGLDISADIAAVQSDTDNIQTRLPAALIGGKMDSDVEAINAVTIVGDGSGTPFNV